MYLKLGILTCAFSLLTDVYCNRAVIFWPADHRRIEILVSPPTPFSHRIGPHVPTIIIIHHSARLLMVIMCCRVDRCCLCFRLHLGIKLLASFLIVVELGVIAVGVFLLPKFLFAIAPCSVIGIICDILLFVCVIRVSPTVTNPA